MFAVVKTGGKQYRVSPGDVVIVEKLLGDAGDTITLADVLMVGDGIKTTVGAPLVAGSLVEATIREQARDDKIIVFKKKRRQGYRRKKGHRQDITVLTINAISVDGHTIARHESFEKVMPPAAIEPEELVITDTSVKAIQTVEKAVKKPAVRKPKLSAVEPAVDSIEAVQVSKPKKIAVKSKKQQEPEA